MHLCAHQSGSPHCHPHKQQFYTGRVFKLLKSLSTYSAIMSFLLEVFVLWRSLCVCVCPGEKPFLCEADGCGRSFAEYSSLRKHMLIHSGEWDRVYSCTTELSVCFWRGGLVCYRYTYSSRALKRPPLCVCTYTVAAWITSPNWLTVKGKKTSVFCMDSLRIIQAECSSPKSNIYLSVYGSILVTLVKYSHSSDFIFLRSSQFKLRSSTIYLFNHLFI